jgi:transcriptional regulator with XRE-family HTH domain
LDNVGMRPASPCRGRTSIPGKGIAGPSYPLRYWLFVRSEAGTPFGAQLRRWRLQRRLSQLALAGLVGSTARHISFLETGRSRPSRQMTLRLATALDVGLRESNELLHAAGLAATYPQARIDGTDLAPYRAVIDRLLAAHEPYPAMVLDGHWNVMLANRACTELFGTDIAGVNFVRDALANPAAAQMIANWAEVAWSGLDRMRRHVERNPFDEELRALVAAAEHALDGVPRPAGDPGIVVCPWFRVDGQLVRTVAMVARFDQAADVTLDELRVELMYPLDDTAERFFRRRTAEHEE